MKTIEQSLSYPLSTSYIAAESYNKLLLNAQVLAVTLEIPAKTEENTLDLLDTLKAHDESTAKECLQTLPLALRVGNILGNYYKFEPDHEAIWVTSILHDIGKTAISKTIIDRSNEGNIWTDQDRNSMRYHPIAGAEIVRQAGFSEKIARPIEEHHHKQYGSPSYGKDPNLTHEERLTRDCVSSADFTDAALNRTNTRNAHLSRLGREQEVIQHLHFLFEDYAKGDEVAHTVATGLLHSSIAA